MTITAVVVNGKDPELILEQLAFFYNIIIIIRRVRRREIERFTGGVGEIAVAISYVLFFV